MKRLQQMVIVTAGVAAMIGQTSASAQQNTTVYESGLWAVMRSVDAQSCTMMVRPNEVSSGFYNIQYRAGLSFVLSTAWKENWRIPKDTKTNVTLVIDRATIGAFEALDINTRALGWGLGLPEWRTTIANLLMNGVQARVIFHGGNEPEWTVSLSGSTAAVGAFIACANSVGGSLSSVPG
jgi:hypothetical protein